MTRRGRRLPWALGGAAMLAQAAYPFLHGTRRHRLTVATVPLFAGASISHALAARGPRWTAEMVATTACVGVLAELVGTRTGFPFGRYEYADTLGPKAFGVPLVIGPAWTMMAYPALLVGRRLVGSAWVGPLVAGAALASWDLFLDPQLVAAGHWRWLDVRAHLPGSPDVPVSNYLGWLTVSTAMMALLWRGVPPAQDGDDRLPATLYLWSYGASLLANLAFFRRPVVALVGGVGMGAVALPFARALARGGSAR